jgi:hypothetical protein
MRRTSIWGVGYYLVGGGGARGANLGDAGVGPVVISKGHGAVHRLHGLGAQVAVPPRQGVLRSSPRRYDDRHLLSIIHSSGSGISGG